MLRLGPRMSADLSSSNVAGLSEHMQGSLAAWQQATGAAGVVLLAGLDETGAVAVFA